MRAAALVAVGGPHDNVAQFLGYSFGPTPFMAFEFCPLGCLKDHLRLQPVPPAQQLAFLEDIAAGMAYVHRHGVVHRDLKAANVLVAPHRGECPSPDVSLVAKVADFGLAKVLPHPEAGDKADEHRHAGRGSAALRHTAETGTYRWMAPEVLAHRPYGLPVDVYSYSIVIFEVLVGEAPYSGLSSVEAAIAVCRDGLRPSFPFEALPEPLRPLPELAAACWATQPEARPGFGEIVLVLQGIQAGVHQR